MSSIPPDHNRGPTYLGVYFGTLSLVIIVVAHRLFIRVRKNSFGVDDVCICIATAVAIYGGVGDVIQVKNGFGRQLVTERQRIILASFVDAEM